ncbi:MAG: hypothetical protein WCO94_00615 [Verrucomicrobiota bacterium]
MKTRSKKRNPAPRRSENRGGPRRMPDSLPSEIARRLRALASRVLFASWAEGFLWTVAVLCGLVIVQGTLDWMFDLTLRVRLLFLGVDLGVIALLIFQFGVRPWRERLTPDEAAIRAERHWPELRTGLISAVQLARHPDGSPVLVKALLGKVALRVATLDFRLAAPWSTLKKSALSALLAAGIASGLTLWLAPASLVLLQRILLSKRQLPTQTIVTALSRDFSIPTGQTIELSAKATGVVPRSGRVEVTYEGKPTETVTVLPKASSPEVFSLQIANVQQPLTYRFFLNDGRGEEWKVTLIHPPVLQEVTFDVTNPPYTGLPQTRLSAGNLNLLAGSKLTITGKSSQPLKSARLMLTGVESSVELKPGGDSRNTFSTQIDIPREGLKGLWIELKNDRDILSQDNTVYAVEIVPDKPPGIVIAEGQPDRLKLVPEQKPALRFDVLDDFRVKEVYLCVQPLSSLGEGEEPDPKKAKQIPISFPQPAAGLTFNYEWKNPGESVDWAEGQTFVYWIKAVDNNDVTGPGITYGSPRQWSVVSLQTKREELAEQLRKHAESIKDLSGAQEGARNELGEILKQGNNK